MALASDTEAITEPIARMAATAVMIARFISNLRQKSLYAASYNLIYLVQWRNTEQYGDFLVLDRKLGFGSQRRERCATPRALNHGGMRRGAPSSKVYSAGSPPQFFLPPRRGQPERRSRKRQSPT
jgi:hypothetical protein